MKLKKAFYVDNNDINFMDGTLFAGLTRLSKLALKYNKCINENFDGVNEIAAITDVITKRCGFCDTDTPIETNVCVIMDHVRRLPSKSLIQSVIDEQRSQTELLKALTSTLSKVEATIARLEAEMTVMKPMKYQMEM